MEKKSRSSFIRAALWLLGVVAFSAGAFMAWKAAERGPGPLLVLVGMDALTWDIMDPMLDKGELPNFRALIARGVRGDLKTLKSTYISASIWTTILTGKVPKYHGIEGWYSTRGFPVNSTSRTTRFLPQILGENGVTTAAVGFMATWPADRINGYIVSDLASYGRFKDSSPAANQNVSDYEYLKGIERVTWPEDLLDEIMPVMLAPDEVPRRVYESVLPLSDREWESFQKIDRVKRDDDVALLKFAVVTDYNFHRAGLEILKRHRPQAYMVYFQGADILEHFFWKYMEPEYFSEVVTEEQAARLGECIRNYYRFLDYLLFEIMTQVGEEATVVVCSDHGQKRVEYWGQDGPHSGQHRVSKPPGVVIMAGPGIRSGLEIEGAVVFDLTPTMLYLMGVPVGKDMNGKVLLDAVTDEFQGAHPLSLIETHDRGMEAAEEVYSPLDDRIRERLRALGYVE